MKKLLLFSILLLVTVNFYSQNKLKIQTLSVSIGNFEPQKGSNKYANFYTDFTLATVYKKNIFELSFDGSFKWLFGMINNQEFNRKNIQISILYGRSIKIYKWINFEALAGIGYFKESYKTEQYITWDNHFSFIENPPDNSVDKLSLRSVSLPIKFRLIFKYSEKNLAGINFSQSFNSVSNYNSIGLIFRHLF